MTRLQEAAVHEAAHAVVAIAVGEGVALAHVRRALVCDGVCVLASGRRRAGAIPQAAIVMAGDLAVRMVDGGWPAPQARPGEWYLEQLSTAPSDVERAVVSNPPRVMDPPAAYAGEKLAAVPASDGEKLAALFRQRFPGVSVDTTAKEAERTAIAILTSNWRAVTAVADRLIEVGELEGNAIHRLAAARGVVSR